ncbi:MAG: hypothetical protein OCD01_14405 [Fibrobacterales bacterium]
MKFIISLILGTLILGCSESTPISLALSSSPMAEDVSSSSQTQYLIDTTLYVTDSIRGITFKRPIGAIIDSSDAPDFKVKQDSSHTWSKDITISFRRKNNPKNLRTTLDAIGYFDEEPSYITTLDTITGTEPVPFIAYQYTRANFVDTVNGVQRVGYYMVQEFIEYSFDEIIIDIFLINYMTNKPESDVVIATLKGSLNFDNFIDAPLVTTPIQRSIMTDARDNQEYPVATIGTQKWMAANLNIITEDSYCYGDSTANCDTYGRLYEWNAAIDSNATALRLLSDSESQTTPFQGICPTGWHLPTYAEWGVLQTYVRSFVGESEGMSLKSVGSWNTTGITKGDGNGFDEFGFDGLAGGAREYDGAYSDLGRDGNWWSSSIATTGDYRYVWTLHSWLSIATSYEFSSSRAHSIRCVMD